jgi:RNA polymerase sigma-70 factor (ECF subfamily)
MTTVEHHPPVLEEARFLQTIRTGDSGAFALLTERYRRELHVHCYRMVASFEDAQDLTQEVFLRAWRRRDTYEGRSTLRAWLYRIATNACLDFLARRRNRVPVAPGQDGAPSEVRYLQPYPDRLLDEVATGSPDDPADAAVAKETIELAFIVAVQHLPPKQRATLILRDVLGWNARQAAAALDTTVPAANSALQRARATMRQQLPDRRLDWRASSKEELSRQDRDLLQRYMDAHSDGDPHALAELLREDLRFAMPPEPGSWVGRDTIVQSWVDSGFGSVILGRWRCRLTWANRQPAVVSYLRRPGDPEFRAFAVDVLTVQDGLVREITTFPWSVCETFGLPATLQAAPRPPTI